MTYRWTFQKKVTAGFAALVCLAVVTAAVGVYALRAAVASKDRVIALNAENLISAARMHAAVMAQRAAFRGYLLAAEDRFLEERNGAVREFADIARDLEKRVYTEEGRRLLTTIRLADADLVATQEQVTQIRRAKGGLAAAIAAFEKELIPRSDALAGHINAFVEREQHLLQQGVADSTAQASLASTTVMGLAVVAVLFAIAIAFFLSRGLSRQIGSAVQHVQNSSAELQSTANQQASGAREAATAMNEVTTTMGELLVTSRQISESAQRVAHIAQETAAAAHTGDEVVAKMQESIQAIKRQVDVIVGHMLDLGKKSQQIGGVLDIINELAEQTNILSINATIEAAGAGESGKRFAVVGDEIRKLADRVSGSTKEIRGLVEEIRGAVNTTVLATEGGSKAVDAGLAHFEEVTRGFKQISGLVGTTTDAAREIELGTRQQMTAVEQVNSAIAGAAQAARETETSTSQTLQTATQLAHLSHDLSQIVQPHPAAA